MQSALGAARLGSAMTNRATVGSFGEKLKREREMRAITLEEIADATKIGTRSLRALEEAQFDLLPGGIFNKGFVRAYARYLGIDEEQAVADYMAALGEQQPESSISEIAEQVEAQRQKERDAARRTGTLWMTLLIGAFIAAGVFGGWKWWSKQQALKFQEQSPAITEPAPAEQPVAPALTPDATQPQAAAPAEPGVTDPNVAAPGATTPDANTTGPEQKPAAPDQTSATEPVRVSIRATQPAWVSVTVDGNRAFSGVLDPASESLKEKSFAGSDRIRLVVGNAGGIEVSYNGKAVEPLGPAGQRREVAFTLAGIEKQR